MRTDELPEALTRPLATAFISASHKQGLKTLILLLQERQTVSLTREPKEQGSAPSLIYAPIFTPGFSIGFEGISL